MLQLLSSAYSFEQQISILETQLLTVQENQLEELEHRLDAHLDQLELCWKSLQQKDETSIVPLLKLEDIGLDSAELAANYRSLAALSSPLGLNDAISEPSQQNAFLLQYCRSLLAQLLEREVHGLSLDETLNSAAECFRAIRSSSWTQNNLKV